MKRVLTVLIALTLLLASAGCQKTDYPSYTLLPKEDLLAGGTAAVGTPIANKNTARQLTAEDIQAMNGGNASIVYGENGYVTFLQGRFYEGRITDHEEAIPALNGVASLIGLAAGSEFFAVSGYRLRNGYTVYTYQQRYGDETVLYATLKLIVDPEGYAAGLASSFEPNLGIADTKAGISAEEAEAVVRRGQSGIELTFFPEEAHKVLVVLSNVCYRAWAIYTNNPEPSADDWGLGYYEHIISMDGTYLYCLPVASLATTNLNAFQPDAYFQGLAPTTLTKEVTLHDGTRETLTLPASYNPNTGRYYLMDAERRIAAADYHSVIFMGNMDFISGTSAADFPDSDVIAYDRYIKTYDFFREVGYESVDGTGLPLLICTGYCDEAGDPVDNAGYGGIQFGFAIFGASDVNAYSEAVDVCAHEFAHGITNNAAMGNYYCNASGAINEAFSDILGNLCEMMGGYTKDRAWLIGENAGRVLRSLSDPSRYAQPTSIYDGYYQLPGENPMETPDYGGVHQNSSLLGQMAVKLHEAGMSMEDQRLLWLTADQLITPLVNYPEVHAALLAAIDMNDLDASYKEVLTEAFNAAGLI